MTKQRVLKQVITLFYLLLMFSPATANENFIQNLIKVNQNKQLLPLYSLISGNVSTLTAYQVQKAYVDLRRQKDPIFGYKAGLTSKAGQKKFKVSQALAGTLFTSGYVNNPLLVQLNSAKKLMLETELGFILAKPINQPIQNIKQLKQYITTLVPVIELPNLGYANPEKLTRNDLIASNLASHQFLIGDKKMLRDVLNVNHIKTQLTRQDKIILTGDATDALGDQWQALLWLVNHLQAQGYPLSKGHLLITGALGKMIPAKKGNYRAYFGSLGEISFKIN